MSAGLNMQVEQVKRVSLAVAVAAAVGMVAPGYQAPTLKWDVLANQHAVGALAAGAGVDHRVHADCDRGWYALREREDATSRAVLVGVSGGGRAIWFTP